MSTAKISLLILICGSVLLLNGCNDLKVQNDLQAKKISELNSELQTNKIQLDALKRQLEDARAHGGIEAETLQQKIAALEKDLADKKALIDLMQQRLISGGVALPVELNTMLEDFAKGSDMISYDPNRGVVKFKSDLLFEKGSDTVAPSAMDSIKALCNIMNSEEGKKFDIIIAGHTDDLRISRPDTREKHPTNWHLSAHRAISVLTVMTTDGIDSERISVRGFGEYRPLEPNKANKQGNPQNRRVEIYIVPKGV